MMFKIKISACNVFQTSEIWAMLILASRATQELLIKKDILVMEGLSFKGE